MINVLCPLPTCCGQDITPAGFSEMGWTESGNGLHDRRGTGELVWFFSCPGPATMLNGRYERAKSMFSNEMSRAFAFFCAASTQGAVRASKSTGAGGELWRGEGIIHCGASIGQTWSLEWKSVHIPVCTTV